MVLVDVETVSGIYREGQEYKLRYPIMDNAQPFRILDKFAHFTLFQFIRLTGCIVACSWLDSDTGIVFAHYLQSGRMFEGEFEMMFG